eukprot:566166-Hanusia_phi.AAC.1
MEKEQMTKRGEPFLESIKVYREEQEHRAPRVCFCTDEVEVSARVDGDDVIYIHDDEDLYQLCDVRYYPTGRKYTAVNILSPRVQAEFEKMSRTYPEKGYDVVECKNLDVKELQKYGLEDISTILKQVRTCSMGMVNPKICVKEIKDPEHPALKSERSPNKSVFGLFAKEDIAPLDVLGEYAGEVMIEDKPRQDLAKLAREANYDFNLEGVHDQDCPLPPLYITGRSNGNELIYANDYRDVAQEANARALACWINGEGREERRRGEVCDAIPKGQEILVDYGDSFWSTRAQAEEEEQEEEHEEEEEEEGREATMSSSTTPTRKRARSVSPGGSSREEELENFSVYSNLSREQDTSAPALSAKVTRKGADAKREYRRRVEPLLEEAARLLQVRRGESFSFQSLVREVEETVEELARSRPCVSRIRELREKLARMSKIYILQE